MPHLPGRIRAAAAALAAAAAVAVALAGGPAVAAPAGWAMAPCALGTVSDLRVDPSGYWLADAGVEACDAFAAAPQAAFAYFPPGVLTTRVFQANLVDLGQPRHPARYELKLQPVPAGTAICAMRTEFHVLACATVATGADGRPTLTALAPADPLAGQLRVSFQGVGGGRDDNDGRICLTCLLPVA